MRTTIAILCVLTVTCHGCPPEVEDPRLIIIFQDISRSLEDDTEKAAQVIVDTIIDNVPTDSEVVVIPICADTAGAPKMRWTVEGAGGITTTDAEEAKQKRAKSKKDLQEFMQRLRASRAPDGTCISPALRRADSEIRSFRSASGADIIFVSDMIEECTISIFGGPATMRENKFTAAAALQDRRGDLPTLPGKTRIFVMRPRALPTTVPRTVAPNDREVRNFWEGMFNRCGVPSTAIRWDPDPRDYVSML